MGVLLLVLFFTQTSGEVFNVSMIISNCSAVSNLLIQSASIRAGYYAALASQSFLLPDNVAINIVSRYSSNDSQFVFSVAEALRYER